MNPCAVSQEPEASSGSAGIPAGEFASNAPAGMPALPGRFMPSHSRRAASSWRKRAGRALLMPLKLAATLAFSFALASNAADVVINEIMYHPPYDREGLQYIELFNAGTNNIDLGGWKLRKGVAFAFPQPTPLGPGGFIVVCRNRSEFIERYGPDVPLAGEFTGKLSHGGERLELADAHGRTVDSVKYSDRAPWPLSPDGHSASLERISPGAPGADPANWAPSLLPRITAPAGTPGKTNDALSLNLPPAVSDLERTPSAPAASQPATVCTTVSDGDGVREVLLLWRIQRAGKAGEETALAMRRVAGDATKGRYGAAIPGQPEGSLVRYRIRATDEAGTVRVLPSTNDLEPAWSFGIFSNTNSARIPLAFIWQGESTRATSAVPRGRGTFLSALGAETPRGDDTLVLMPPDGGPVRIFDHIRVQQRNSGFKVHFLKNNTWNGISGVNVIFESARSALSEVLSFDLYRRTGVPAPMAEHWRVWVDGKPRGYQLVFEQPNKSFLTRHGRNDSGNLYKLLWYGNGVIGQHEKKTNLQVDHDDLIALLKGLEETEGEAQWKFIGSAFNVTNFIDYFAVNMCIQNWDGFFNNYFTYHDSGGTGRWEIYPWDEDKTWGDFDGASARLDWYALPLTFGMNGDQPPGNRARPGARSPRLGMRPGAMWWRPPGWFSGPLLANVEFRKRFLVRLRQICDTFFTPDQMNPRIDALEQRLEPEISADGKQEFHRHIQSFRDQVVGRRKFILTELAKEAK